MAVVTRVMTISMQGVPVLGEAGDDFAADRPPFSAGSGVYAGLWHADVPSRHLPPEIQARAVAFDSLKKRIIFRDAVFIHFRCAACPVSWPGA